MSTYGVSQHYENITKRVGLVKTGKITFSKCNWKNWPFSVNGQSLTRLRIAHNGSHSCKVFTQHLISFPPTSRSIWYHLRQHSQKYFFYRHQRPEAYRSSPLVPWSIGCISRQRLNQIFLLCPRLDFLFHSSYFNFKFHWPLFSSIVIWTIYLELVFIHVIARSMRYACLILFKIWKSPGPFSLSWHVML
jgi:hypothetical protein